MKSCRDCTLQRVESGLATATTTRRADDWGVFNDQNWYPPGCRLGPLTVSLSALVRPLKEIPHIGHSCQSRGIPDRSSTYLTLPIDLAMYPRAEEFQTRSNIRLTPPVDIAIIDIHNLPIQEKIPLPPRKMPLTIEF